MSRGYVLNDGQLWDAVDTLATWRRELDEAGTLLTHAIHSVHSAAGSRSP